MPEHPQLSRCEKLSARRVDGRSARLPRHQHQQQRDRWALPEAESCDQRVVGRVMAVLSATGPIPSRDRAARPPT